MECAVTDDTTTSLLRPPATSKTLRRWLCEEAAQLWAVHGVDRAQGGFYEKLERDLTPVEEPRRARLVARQIYLFAAAARLGWQGPASELVRHGLRFLNAHLITEDGRVRASCGPNGVIVDDSQHLYDVAFVLFGLAEASEALASTPEATEAKRTAERIAVRLAAESAHPAGGYVDEATPGLQCANPHMHLFEAFLAWAERPGAAADRWMARAFDIAQIAVEDMILPGSGALAEHFDAEWRPVPQNGYLVIEPGHQFEWSWLLARWDRLAGAPAAGAAAAHLAEIGEAHGVDPDRDVAVHALDSDLAVRDPAAKLWPQTERAKAWHARALITGSAKAAERRDRALAAIGRYLSGPAPGLWHEVMDARGAFHDEPVKASSGYHVVCAIETACSGHLAKEVPL